VLTLNPGSYEIAVVALDRSVRFSRRMMWQSLESLTSWFLSQSTQEVRMIVSLATVRLQTLSGEAASLDSGILLQTTPSWWLLLMEAD